MKDLHHNEVRLSGKEHTRIGYSYSGWLTRFDAKKILSGHARLHPSEEITWVTVERFLNPPEAGSGSSIGDPREPRLGPGWPYTE